LAESWDNVGLIVGDEGAVIDKVLVTVDLTLEVIAEAKAGGFGAVVAYHPPVFQAQKRLLAGDLGYEAARAGLAVYSPHTALDVVDGGTNDAVCAALGLVGVEPLKKRAVDEPRPKTGTLAPPPAAPIGLGRVGWLEPQLGAREFMGRVKARLSLPFVLVAGPLDRKVARVGVCAGSGGSLIDAAARAGAHAFVAGELSHHDALACVRKGMVAITTLHSNTERLALPAVVERLATELTGITVELAKADRDPFTVL
jgi:dinuclear metal center YbgI/SA1388 family protein